MATLYIVATPIGNLEDITQRALTVLGQVEAVLCEDTRVTRKLLSHFGIQKELVAYHAQSSERRTREILDWLKKGATLALVSDAGTPGINDPGGKLVERLRRELSDVSIVPIPGASVVTTSLSVSGFPAHQFVYLGFPPQKKGRERFFERLSQRTETVVFLESPHRIMKALTSLSNYLGDRPIMVAAELTKMHERIYWGTPSQVTDHLQNDTIKGEFVVVIRQK